MKIILKEDVQNLGHRDDVVEVKNGYALNYLIPQGFAIMATPSALKVHSENMKQRAHKEAKLRADAEALAAKLEGLQVTVATKVSSTGKVFGSVKLPHERLLVSAFIVFFVFDCVLSASAALRMNERAQGVSPSNRIEQFLDTHYPDEKMNEIYANSKPVEK